MTMDPEREKPMNRRSFLTGLSVAAVSAGAGLAALSPLINAREIPSTEELLQQHYHRLTPEDKQQIFQRLEKDIAKEYGIQAKISDTPPIPQTSFAYALNIGRCIGCRKCVYACMNENNQSRSPQIQYIRVLKMPKGTIDLEKAVHDYPKEEAGDKDFYYMPVQCQQCDSPPCVKVCPVKATWKEKDGPVVIDYNWCIGCRYCAAACPYHARRFNFAKPGIAPNDINPDMGYLSNRLRYTGVMEKCTFCLHRIRKGLYPSCAEVCPTGARKFGNLNDPKSEIRKIIDNERVYILKQDLKTLPKFYYVFAK